MNEYSNVLGDNKVDHSKLKGNKYYLNHLKALELQKEDEERDSKDLKIKIMHQAQLMAYDDDFDEEDMYSNKPKKYHVDIVKSQGRTREESKKDNLI